MTTFPIPKGKIVDRIEVDAGDGEATINIIYKEDEPKEEKRVVVVCETDEPSCLYFSNLTGELTCMTTNAVPDPRYYVRMKKAEEGEFTVVQSDTLFAALAQIKEQIKVSLRVDKEVAKAWDALVILFMEHKE